MDPFKPLFPKFEIMPIIEEPDPFKQKCNHKLLVLRKEQEYTYLTNLRKVYTCMDCNERFTILPERMKMLPMNNSFQISNFDPLN